MVNAAIGVFLLIGLIYIAEQHSMGQHSIDQHNIDQHSISHQSHRVKYSPTQPLNFLTWQ